MAPVQAGGDDWDIYIIGAADTQAAGVVGEVLVGPGGAVLGGGGGRGG